MKFVEAVEEILVLEHLRTRDEASDMVKRFPTVMVNAMMAGRGREYRAAAMALEMAESDDRESLADWLDRWEQDYADGQTTISRAEAIRRWEQERKCHEPEDKTKR